MVELVAVISTVSAVLPNMTFWAEACRVEELRYTVTDVAAPAMLSPVWPIHVELTMDIVTVVAVVPMFRRLPLEVGVFVHPPMLSVRPLTAPVTDRRLTLVEKVPMFDRRTLDVGAMAGIKNPLPADDKVPPLTVMVVLVRVPLMDRRYVDPPLCTHLPDVMVMPEADSPPLILIVDQDAVPVKVTLVKRSWTLEKVPAMRTLRKVELPIVNITLLAPIEMSVVEKPPHAPRSNVPAELNVGAAQVPADTGTASKKVASSTTRAKMKQRGS
jgi:hypothetical protein